MGHIIRFFGAGSSAAGSKAIVTFVVTGSNGFIGYNNCRRLVEAGEKVIGVDDLSSGLAEDAVPGVQYHVRSVTEADWLVHLLQEERPRAVIHLAAVPRVAYSVAHPLPSTDVNLMGTLSVLNAIVKAGLVEHTRLVFASSSSVYGGAEVLPTPEIHPCNPQSPYGLAKLQAEHWCALFHRLYGLDVVSLRYFNVFGPLGRFGGAYSTVLPAWLHHLFVAPAYQPFLEGDGEQSRDFCFVGDVVQANIAAATRERGFAAEVFNIGRGAACTLLDLKAAIEEVVGNKPLPLERRPPRVGDVKHTLADISRARTELGFRPGEDFLAELRETAAWYRSQRPAPSAA